MTTGRHSFTMDAFKIPRVEADAERPTARADRFATWIVLALGLLFMLVSAARGEQRTASRVDRFNGSLAAGQTVQVDNVSGDIIASPGREFSAVVTVTVSAGTQRKAEELLAAARVLSEHDEDGWSLTTRWPGMHSNGGRRSSLCEGCRVVARYELVLPPGVAAELQTVNGDVRVRECDGELQLESVNGAIEARGVRRSLQAQTVNGKINATVAAVPPGTAVNLESVNGTLTLILPRDAKFDLSASTMNGTIASTFPLPRNAAQGADDETPRPSKSERKILIKTEGDETTVVDLEELERELEDSMREVDISIDEDMRHADQAVREAQREIRRIRVADPRREYSGSVGNGGAQIQLETLNGSVLVLAAGTPASDARPLVSEVRSFVVTVPPVRVKVPKVEVDPRVVVVPPAPRVPPAPAVPPVPPVPPVGAPPVFDGEVIRGDISGDFLSTSTGGNYRIGHVSGRVRILTHSGEIRVESIGGPADLKSFGGDIVVGPVQGDLKASTAAGDIRADAVKGSVLADTAGGDIRIASASGSLDAKTAGGDIIVPSVGGSVRAVTAGGDVRIGVGSRDLRGSITIHNSGGDVSLTLPAEAKADVELVVTGAEDDDLAIRSDFPDLTISRKHGVQRATLSLNGGGEKIVIRTSSGTIRLKKGL